jgi:Tat protein translocase TatB subunit
VFNVGPAEVLMILVVALLVLGPKRLPEAARQMGKAMSEFRRVSSDLQSEVRTAFAEPEVAEPAAVEPKPLDPPPATPADAELPTPTDGDGSQ